MRNQDHRDTDPSGASLKAKLRRQIDDTQNIRLSEPDTSTPLGCKIVLWIIAIAVFLFILFGVVLVGALRQGPYAQVSQSTHTASRNRADVQERQSQHNAEVRVFNYLSSEKSLMGRALFAYERDSVVQWVFDRLSDYNQEHDPKVTKQSTITEKIRASEEIIDQTLTLTDGADRDDGVNDRFSSSRETIKKGGGDETDLAHMKLTFLHVLGVPAESVHAVLFKNDRKEEYRAVAVVTLPDGKKVYLDKFNSTRDPESDGYREFKEYNPYTVIENQ